MVANDASSSDYGSQLYYIDTDNVKVQTAKGNILFIDDNGDLTSASLSYIYAQIIVEVKI